MRRSLLLFAFLGGVTLLAAGIAFAEITDVRCNGGECRGTGEDERLFGSASEDLIYAGGGDDRVYGRRANDALKGEQGNDKIDGQEGDDRVKGGPGRDRVFGDSGDDLVRGGTHTQADDGVPDILDCGDGTDTVYFTPGVDVVSNCEIRNPSQ